MKRSFFPPAWLAAKKIILGLAISCGLYTAAITNAAASASCDAVNAGAFNFINPAFDLGNSSILTGWSIGDKITVTFTDAVGLSHTDGLYKGPLNAIALLQGVTVPSGGNASFTYTVVSGDLSSGILIDPENNDSVTATCAAAATTATTTALVTSPNPSKFGQLVTLTATVSGSGGTPTGTVTFKDGATTLGAGTLVSGTVTLQTSSLAVGGHTLTAVYGGDASFVGSTSLGVSQTVNQGATTTVLVASPNPSNVGQVVTFTATVAVTSPAAGTPMAERLPAMIAAPRWQPIAGAAGRQGSRPGRLRTGNAIASPRDAEPDGRRQQSKDDVESIDAVIRKDRCGVAG